MPKDCIHHGGWEHRDVHNVYGMLFAKTTSQGLVERATPSKRPFVLTRSFYAGAQRFAAMWTGDNMTTWEHMAVGISIVLSNNVAGMSFAGCPCFFHVGDQKLTRFLQLISEDSSAIRTQKC
jgi:alpha 1,3-glucosidase